jgi:hypothetical protein
MDSDVGKSGALKYGHVLRMNTDDGSDSDFHKKFLKPHIERNLLQKPQKVVPFWMGRKRDTVYNVTHAADMLMQQEVETTKPDLHTVERDDYVSPITIETYVEFRGKPITLAYERLSPKMNLMLSSLEVSGRGGGGATKRERLLTRNAPQILTFVFTSSGAIMAIPAFRAAQWVAITVALGTATTSIVDYFQLKIDRDTRNNNLAEYQNLMTWWDSLSIIDKRTKAAKEKAVGTIEKGILLLHERIAGAAMDAGAAAEEEEAEE